jgi:hypothetical protein
LHNREDGLTYQATVSVLEVAESGVLPTRGTVQVDWLTVREGRVVSLSGSLFLLGLADGQSVSLLSVVDQTHGYAGGAFDSAKGIVVPAWFAVDKVGVPVSLGDTTDGNVEVNVDLSQVNTVLYIVRKGCSLGCTVGFEGIRTFRPSSMEYRRSRRVGSRIAWSQARGPSRRPNNVSYQALDTW